MIEKSLKAKKTKGLEQDSKNQLRSPMPRSER
jgi:hypothetical protein